MDMIAVPEVAVWTTVGAAAGVVAAGVTEAAKRSLRGWLRSRHQRDPWWWQGLWRVVPMLIGGLVGWALWGAPWGCAIGTAGGALSAVIYRVAGSRVASMAGASRKAGGSDE